MAIAYFVRYRMERPLDFIPEPELPPGFVWVPWSESLLEVHAEVLYQSFAGELDSLVFPSLGSRPGCRRVMANIAYSVFFVPEATWMVATEAGEYCGTIQGAGASDELGAIQNLGVVPAYRRLGLGRALLLKALHGFKARGYKRAMLEVTAENEPAVRLYESLGFTVAQVLRRRSSEPDL